MVRIRSPILFMAVVAVLTLALAAPAAFAGPLPGGTLDPLTIPKYVTPLVIPPVMNDSNPNNRRQDKYDIAVRQFRQQILPGGIWDFVAGTSYGFPATTLWSYGPAEDPLPDSTALGGALGVAPAPNSQFNYPAYTFETRSNKRVNVRWINDLKTGFGAGPDCLPHLLPIDQTLHWANPPQDCRDGSTRTDCAGDNPEFYTGPVPIVTHVHGAHVDPHSDGYPEAWWLPACNVPAGYATKGTLFDDATGTNPGTLGYADYSYRQDQPATTLWYHDHSLGMTRSNVYAGPAGFWLIRGGEFDRVFLKLRRIKLPGLLPGPAPEEGDTVLELNVPGDPVRNRIREIPIVIQDRSFNLVDDEGNLVENPADAVEASLFYPDNRAFFEGLAPDELTIPFVPDSDIAPIWNPEAFFNVMVVNGVSWPQLEVAPARYRFRFLNGCNSRFLILRLVKATDPADPATWQQVTGAFWQIGAEQGFLPAPVQLDELLMGLAERADVIMDFRHIPLASGQGLYLVNVGPDEPFGGGTPVFGCDPEGAGPADCFEPSDPGTTGQVMKFIVNKKLLQLRDFITTPPTILALNAEPPLTGPIAMTRTLSLNEGSSEKVCVTFNEDGSITYIPEVVPVPPQTFEQACEAAGGEPFGPKEALLGIVNASMEPVALKWTDTTGTSTPVNVTLQNGAVIPVNVTENPTVNTIEQWDIYNVTADAHPIHLHLVRFQVIDREGLETTDGEVDIPLTPDGNVRGPETWEYGFKDTVISYPGEITRVKALFDIEGLYVWHCHIVEHEDNEMMRPFVVSAAP